MQNEKGFSLVELMVVVAIIAALSMVALPSYRSFQARARQKEGFNQLSAFYSAAQATKAEFGHYPGNLIATGYQPVGQLIYRLRSNDGTDLPGATAFDNDDACWNTSFACDCGGNCTSYKTWDESPNGIIGSRVGVAVVNNAPLCPMGAFNTTDNSFVVGIAAVISTTATSVDRYAMNERKVIQMCVDGLK